MDGLGVRMPKKTAAGERTGDDASRDMAPEARRSRDGQVPQLRGAVSSARYQEGEAPESTVRR